MKVSDGHRSRAQQASPPQQVFSTNTKDLAGELRGRLLAQATVLNGGNVTQAAIDVFGRDPSNGGKGNHKGGGLSGMLRSAKGTKAFADELERMLANVNIDKDAALRQLWAMVNVSLVDFLDDQGNVMPIHDLKQLPREAQQIISEMEIKRAYKPVRGTDGEYLYDPATRQPMLRPEVTVKLKLPEKIKAIQTIASILKWVETNTNVTINIAQVMKSADERLQSISTAYPAVEQEADPS